LRCWPTERKPAGSPYVIDASSLPITIAGTEWGEDKKFNAAEELLIEPSLKVVFKTAREKGCAVRTVK
jgi:hypothetical protein